MCNSIPVYSIYLQVMSNLHTHTRYCFVWGCNVFWLKRGRQKELGRYGINMNHMIALKSLESSFLRQIFTFDLNILDKILVMCKMLQFNHLESFYLQFMIIIDRYEGQLSTYVYMYTGCPKNSVKNFRKDWVIFSKTIYELKSTTKSFKKQHSKSYSKIVTGTLICS